MKYTLSLLLSAVALNASAAITLVSAWDLNEGSGTTTNQATLSGAQTWNQVDNPSEVLAGTASADFSTASGLSWGAASTAPGSSASLTFTGANAVNTLNTNVSTSLLNGTGSKTFVAWINADLGSDGGSILSYSPSHGNDAGQDLRLALDASGNLRAEVNSGFLVSNATDFRGAGWNMVAVVFNGNTNTSSFYVGGTGFVGYSSAADRAINTSNTADGDPATTVNFVIGGDQATRNFEGGIDMVGVYTGAASLAELNSIYTNGIAIPEPGTLMLVGVALGTLMIFRRRR
jgi:hypothetical protein